MINFEMEAALGGRVCGVDEAGRGPLAGPVVAAAVILNPSAIPDGIADSKTLKRARREALYDQIMASAQVAIAAASTREILRRNILHASLLAMTRAVRRLPQGVDAALIDGNWLPPDLPCPAEAIVKGDARCLSIAAASIIAKTTRDRIMTALARRYPAYGWDHNAGYGTKLHLAGLATAGVSPHHRRGYAPVKALLEFDLTS